MIDEKVHKNAIGMNQIKSLVAITNWQGFPEPCIGNIFNEHLMEFNDKIDYY